jgi:hypothetical protein
MRLILTGLMFLFGLFNLFLGMSFLLNPVAMGEGFHLAPVGLGGMAVLRADMTAFFLVAGGCQLWGGWRRNGDLLLVPIALFAFAFSGRAVSALVDGAITGFWFEMSIEALQVVLGIAAWRLLPHHQIDEITG